MKTEQPAFPTWARNEDMIPGMTLRDFFANSAMQSLLSVAPKDWHEAYKDDEKYLPMIVGVPLTAYEFADAMLKAREQ